jgi:cation diffusion facilitator CzcD-associated flavoprotein CzcO
MDAIIVGAGMSGMLCAIKLREMGCTSIVILDKADDVGGTWHENRYPGSGCDVPSHLYSYSFAPNPGWTRGYSLQPEIKAYFRKVAEDYGLLPLIRFGTEVMEARFDESNATWTVTSTAGESWTAPILILGVGQLNKPAIPDIPGRASFKGPQFHSAQWDDSVDFTGKSVAVIGSGASAVQFVPHIVKDAAKMTMFQRSANWIMQRNDTEIPEKTRAAYAKYDWLRKLQRGYIHVLLDQRSPIFEKPGGKVAQGAKQACIDYMQSIITDPEMRAKLTPDYEIGCKRILVSDDFYPALAQPNAFVETTPIEKIEKKGARLADGTLVEADIIVWGTGFDTHHFISPMEVYGRSGRRLADDWQDGAEAYRGVSVTGYPNMFVMYGPNTNTGHISIIYMVEQQARYAMQAIERLRKGHASWIEVRPEAQAAYNAEVRKRLDNSVWATGCNSWYRTATGKIPNNYPGRAGQFANEMRHFEDDAYMRG